jgi:hypothetical protein
MELKHGSGEDEDDVLSSASEEDEDKEEPTFDPWTVAIRQIIQHHDSTSEDILTDTQLLLLLRVKVTNITQTAGAFENDPTYKMIVKEFMRVKKMAKGLDDKECLEFAWHNCRPFIEHRISDNMHLFEDDESETDDVA